MRAESHSTSKVTSSDRIAKGRRSTKMFIGFMQIHHKISNWTSGNLRSSTVAADKM